MQKFIGSCLTLTPNGRPGVKDLLTHPQIIPHVKIDTKE